jgi:HAD superfamily phosphatase
MMKPLLVFDMDGVLVDVAESYRETIHQTVMHFTGAGISREAIQDYKNQGGWNDDWQLSHHVISGRGVQVPFEEEVEHFQGLFHGRDGIEGLILREVWIAQPGTLERLADAFRFAIFTGRMKWEAEFTLRRFAPHLAFEPIIGLDEVANLKPAPDGLLKIRDANPGCPMWYVGDTVDDARCARSAGVPFVGIAEPAKPRHTELVALFHEQQARAVIGGINQLEAVLHP